MTTREPLIKTGVISSVQLIDYHFPDWVGARWAVLSITVALVGHPMKVMGVMVFYTKYLFIQLSND